MTKYTGGAKQNKWGWGGVLGSCALSLGGLGPSAELLLLHFILFFEGIVCFLLASRLSINNS